MATQDPSQLRLVHDRAELDDCIAAGATALVHAVEGGCLLGDTDAEIEANCAELAKKGVGYVTVAHLFFRQVATNANALPFMPDPIYDFFFPQRGKDRLTPRGEAVVRGLVENRILIDLSHMDPGGISETFTLLDEIDPDSEVPVISTHAGYRFGKQQYMCDEEILLQIKRRKGVVGLIMARHQLNQGVGHRITGPRASQTKLRRHGRRTGALGWEFCHVYVSMTPPAWPTSRSWPTRRDLPQPASCAALSGGLPRWGSRSSG